MVFSELALYEEKAGRNKHLITLGGEVSPVGGEQTVKDGSTCSSPFGTAAARPQ